MEVYNAMILILVTLQVSSAARHVVYWDKEQIPSLADGGLQITLEIDDWMDVLCPYAPGFTGDMRHHHRRNQAMLQLFNVTEEGYEDCDIGKGILLQLCDDPNTEKKLTTKFQERSPYPFGFTFRPGSTYYYISKPIQDVSKGCTRDTMKMKVNVKSKGAVFDVNHYDYTITYNNRNQNKGHKKHTDTVESGHVKPPHRHNHHERSTTKSTTRPPRVVIQYETPPKKTPKIRASAVQQDDPDNGAPGLRNISKITMTILAVLSTLALYVIESSFWH